MAEKNSSKVVSINVTYGDEHCLPIDEQTTLLLCNDKSITVSVQYQAIATSPDDTAERKGGTIFSSVFTLVSTMIGGGMLSLPFAFQQGGLIVSSVVLFLTLLTSTYGAFLIINSTKYCPGQIKNIEDVAQVAFGKPGQILVEVLLILLLYLSSVAYFLLITEQMAPVLAYFFPTSTCCNNKGMLLIIVFAIVFPISLGRNLSALRFTSTLSVLCGILLCACVSYRCVLSDFGGPTDDLVNPVKWFPTSLGGFITCVSIAEVGYSCHFNVLPMYEELQQQTRRNKRIILILAMGIAFVMNTFISIFGYLEFRRFTAQDITQNYPQDDRIVTLGRVSFCLVLLLSYPLLIVPCRATINKMVWRRGQSVSSVLELFSDKERRGPNVLTWVVQTLILVGSSTLLAYVVPQVNMMWGLVGAVGCTTLIYILPPAFYLRVRCRNEKVKRSKKFFPFLLIIVGVIMLLVGIYQAVMNIFVPVTTVHAQAYIQLNHTRF